MRHLPFLLLAACGLFGSTETPMSHRDILVNKYADVSDTPTRFPTSLGYTFPGLPHSEVGDDSYDDRIVCLINVDLATDADPDRIVRVIMHELENALLLGTTANGFLGVVPSIPNLSADWYLWEGDSQDPFHPVPQVEADWIASLPQHHVVHVSPDDAWYLAAPTAEAIDRLNTAAGMEMFE